MKQIKNWVILLLTIYSLTVTIITYQSKKQTKSVEDSLQRTQNTKLLYEQYSDIWMREIAFNDTILYFVEIDYLCPDAETQRALYDAFGGTND